MKTIAPEVTFLESQPALTPGAPCLLGVPYEGTACFRKGTIDGPDAVRAVSDGLESYSPPLDRDLRDAPFADLGNLDLSGVTEPEAVVSLVQDATSELLAAQTIPILLGGEHSFTPGAVAAAHHRYPELAVLQLDAHADLREEWSNTPWSHACAMRRVLDILPSHRLLQCGIRSGTREEFSELHQSSRLVAPDPEALRASLAPLENSPLYLTIDLDLFDPSVLPGTGTPEPGGITWNTMASLLSVVPWQQVVACDLVELSPSLDPSGCSSIVAAKTVREILLAIADARRR